MASPQDEIALVFAEWLSSTRRPASRTKLTPERRSTIKRALAAHGLNDCLAAVRNIGASEEARSGYGRGTRFDDIKHALGTAERIERWRDWQPPTSHQANGKPTAGQLLRELAAANPDADTRTDLTITDGSSQ